MVKENKKYDRVVDILRKSKPVFNEAEEVSERVIKQVQQENFGIGFSDLILEFLFGWVYIGWIRRSMVAAALVVIIIFGYQQTIIIKRINELSGKKIYNEAIPISNPQDDLSDYLMQHRNDFKRLSDKRITVSEKEIDKLIKSVNKLQVKYKDIIILIENDPQLKKYVNDKMKEKSKY